MKCAFCGKEIKGRDYINASTPEKEIYVHSMPCEWYENEGNTDDDGAFALFVQFYPIFTDKSRRYPKK